MLCESCSPLRMVRRFGSSPNLLSPPPYARTHARTQGAPVDMSTICEIVTAGDAMTGYTAAQDAINHFTEECFDVNYADMIAEMQNTSLASAVAGGSRQWVWCVLAVFDTFIWFGLEIVGADALPCTCVLP